MTLKLLPEKWETERLILSNTLITDAPKLQKVYEDHFDEEWHKPENKMLSNYMKKYILDPELPPGGKSENQKLQTVRLKENGNIIGYLDFYHGWPNKEIFWLADLFLLFGQQGKSYGEELVQALIEQVRKIGNYNSMRCNVSLKNWPGIRFWFKNGFSKIIGYSGDKKYSEKSFADITLELDLRY